MSNNNLLYTKYQSQFFKHFPLNKEFDKAIIKGIKSNPANVEY